MEEGYIKFDQTWQAASAPQAVDELIDLRQRLYRQGLIGYDATQQVGFGNLSRRTQPGEAGLFIISGTQTGALAQLTAEHFVAVTAYDLAANRLHSQGPLRASSESLTHAAVYASDPRHQVVLHVHSLRHWQRLYGQYPTTDPAAAYGTPDMAQSVLDLHRDHPALAELGIVVMSGHEEGLLAFGPDGPSTYQRLQQALTWANQQADERPDR